MSEHVRKNVMFLDTNVLYGELSCDMFLTLGEAPTVGWEAKWNGYVLDELREHLTERIRVLYPRQSKEAVERKVLRRLTAMATFLPHACVAGWEKRVDEVRSMVSDPDDAPVLAGAVAAGADCLVTSNIGDFNVSAIAKRYGMLVRSPGDMLCSIFDEDKESAVAELTAMLESHTKPPRSFRELCERLRTMPEFVKFAVLLENEARKRAEICVLSSHSTPCRNIPQPRDRRGRFAEKPSWGDDDLDYYGDVWDADGNFR